MDVSGAQLRPVDLSGIPNVVAGRWRLLVFSSKGLGHLFLLCSLLIIGFYVSATSGALTSGEMDALNQILIAFPDLSSVAYWRRYSEGVDYGGSWKNDFSAMCQQGDGYEYHGVYCADGHVGGLFIGPAMGLQMSTNFSGISGLSFLTNLTIAKFNSAGENFAMTVIRALPIQNLDAQDLKLNSSDFYAPSALQYLNSRQHNGFNITDFVSLRTLIVRSDNMLLGRFPSYLQELSFDPPIIPWTTMTSLLAALPNIKSFSSTVSLDSMIVNAGEAILQTESIESLQLAIVSPSAVNIIIESDSLRHLGINIDNPQQGNFSTPNLTSLVLTGRVPAQFQTLTKLEYLSYRGARVGTAAADFPDLDFAPGLKNLELRDLVYDDSNLTRIICSAAGTNSLLEVLQLNSVENDVPNDLNIPACLRSVPNLRVIDIFGFNYPGAAFNPSAFFQNLPPSITSLTISNIFSSPVPLTDFYIFELLKSLSITGAVTGDIPSNFFTGMSDLSSIGLYATTLNGTLPLTGWSQLVHLEVDGLQIDWPELGPAPLLETLSIQAQTLTTLPRGSSFINAGLDSLTTFILRGNTINATLPTFWAHLPNISKILLEDLNIAGTLPSSISAPKLHQLHVGNNALCGPLPEILVPIQLEDLDLSFNHFSGPIPTSWEANLTITWLLSLKDNFLSGTIPPHFLDHHGYQVNLVDLSDNDFTGPFWKMNRGAPKGLYATNTGLEMCGVDPEIPTALPISCSITNVSECSTSRCDPYWARCIGLACSERTFTPRSIPFCSAIPESPSPPPTDANLCPQPRPYGFDCVGGQWVSPGPISEPSITLPPNSGIITVNGNLSTSGTIIFDGIGTTLEVQGCVEILPNLVVIEVKGTQKLNPTTLINQKGSNCTSDLSLIPVKVDQQNDSCKKTTISTSDSTKSALHVVFRIDSNSCNVKWIILGSVLGGVILLTAIVTAVAYHKSTRCRKLVRSCNAKKASNEI